MTTTKEDIVATIISALLGAAGAVGLLFAYLRRFLDKKLDARENSKKKRREDRLRRLEVEEELFHAQGRLNYYFVKAIQTGQHNGDLQRAWDTYQAAEIKKKTLDREIIAEHEADL